jgi:hypothetical protein
MALNEMFDLVGPDEVCDRCEHASKFHVHDEDEPDPLRRSKCIVAEVYRYRPTRTCLCDGFWLVVA